LDQELIAYRYSSCSILVVVVVVVVVVGGDALRKSLKFRRVKSDRDEIWQDCSQGNTY